MIIKSNTAGKINKMINGTIFSSEVIFVKEFLQNAQRAKASMVNITVDDSSIVFIDNGKGCKKPSNLFTLDFSDWGNGGTTEGFGIGFWSCLAIKGLISVKVRSYNWMAKVLVEDLLNNNLDVALETDLDIINGFQVELVVDNICTDKTIEIEREVKEVSQYLTFLTFYNNLLIEKIDIFSSIDGDFVKKIENRYFEALLSVDEFKYSQHGVPTLFYDKREVRNIYDIEYIHGVIEAKPGKIDLKEPDRTDFIWNSRYKEFVSRVKKEVKSMYIDFLKSNPGKAIIDKYSEAIDYYLDVKDYEKYLNFNDLIDFIQDTPKSNSIDASEYIYTPYTRDLTSYTDKSTKDSLIKTEDNRECTTIDFDKTENISSQNTYTDTELLDSEIAYTTEEIFSDELENTSIEDIKEEFSIDNYFVENSKKSNIIKRQSHPTLENTSKFLKKELMKRSKMAWVLKEEITSYKEEISKAEYVGIKVVELDNILYANIFKKYNKMHISEFTDSFKETFKFKNISLKNSKEIRAIENLIPICKKYNLPLNTFVIGDIEINRSLNYYGKTLYKSTTKNKKGNIEVYAVEHNGLIILDRTALSLSKFKLPKDGPFGINDLKYIFFVTNTIAHELAHFLYQTQDNTIEHYRTEIKLQEEITKLYI